MDTISASYLVLGVGGILFVLVSYLRNPEEVERIIEKFLDPDES